MADQARRICARRYRNDSIGRVRVRTLPPASPSTRQAAKPHPRSKRRFDEDEEEEDEEEDDLDRARRAAERAQRNAPPPQPIRFADVVSGQFDADETSPEVPPLKRVLLPEADSPKLHKVLAQAGLGSRLEMERLILEGRISVNNEPAHIGQRIQFGDQVKFNGKPIRFRIAPPPARVIAYHKPVGEVVTHDDPQNRPTVFRKLPRLQQGKWQSVGRLDLNTEGLLLFTSSGELANQLMHPRFGLEREYAVRVLGALSNEEKQRLLDGVQLDDGRGPVRHHRGRRRRGLELLVSRHHFGRAQPRSAAHVRIRRPCREPADPHPLWRDGAAAWPQARRLAGARRPRHSRPDAGAATGVSAAGGPAGAGQRRSWSRRRPARAEQARRAAMAARRPGTPGRRARVPTSRTRWAARPRRRRRAGAGRTAPRNRGRQRRRQQSGARRPAVAFSPIR